jgi:mannose-6-phosphate isomerase-like protein (cupin superfamily)
MTMIIGSRARDGRAIHTPRSLTLAAALDVACSTQDTESARRAGSHRTGVPRRETTVEATSSSVDSAMDQRPSGGHGDVEFYPVASLVHVGDSLTRGSTTGHTLRAHDVIQYVQVRRVASAVPEVHDRWIDVTVVQAGRGALLAGEREIGDRLESPGERRGGVIQGGATQAIATGDLLMIPAGVPHQYRIAVGDSLRELITKVLDRTPR